MTAASASVLIPALSFMAFGQGEKAIKPKPPEVKSFLSEDRVAVLVGIDHYYDESGFGQLSHAEADATDLADALKKQKYNVHVIPETKAVRNVILKQLRDYANTKGTLIFFFSGHGGAGLKNPQESYLATMDVDSDDIDRTGLSIKEVQDILKDSPAERKMMFLDACRDGSTPPSADGTKSKSKTPRVMQTLAGSSGLRVLYSTTPGKRSYEDDILGHGVFTKFLIDGINGAAAGPDGLVTFRTLEDFVTQKVREYKPIQQPYEGPSDGAIGDFYLAGEPKVEAGRKALVVGIDKHPGQSLMSAVKDSDQVTGKLKTLGFEVTQTKNTGTEDFLAAIKGFAKSLGPEDTAVFYYSGSGGLCDGLPVMVTSDVSPGEEARRSRGVVKPSPFTSCGNMIPVTIMAYLSRGRTGPTMGFFDMCLTHMNPVEIKPGELAQDNVYFLFSTQPGEGAYENNDGGYFTQVLLQLVDSPGISTSSLPVKIGLKIKNTLPAKQFPYEVNGLSEPFYFAQ